MDTQTDRQIQTDTVSYRWTHRQSDTPFHTDGHTDRQTLFHTDGHTDHTSPNSKPAALNADKHPTLRISELLCTAFRVHGFGLTTVCVSSRKPYVLFLQHATTCWAVQIWSPLQRNCMVSVWGAVARDLAEGRRVGVCGYEGCMC